MKGLETDRLILRNWVKSDVESLYEIASDEHVGPACGWEPHRDIGEMDICQKPVNV